MRYTLKDLEGSARTLSEITGQEFSIRNAYGSVGLDIGGENGRHITALQTKGQLYTFIDAMIKGAYAAKGEL